MSNQAHLREPGAPVIGLALRHRNDIDGLRAVAVVPIVLFHAGIEQMSGGFTGVDIFFVISGYLITGIIARELDGARFSLLRFYQRRVLRIVPALVVTLLCTLAAGCLLLLPSELDRLSSSSAAAALFVSNIYFWKTTDYFAGAAQTVPLLHTWSLGVEEQFYIFYPLGLLILHRWWPRSRTFVLILAAALSFAADIRWELLGSVTGFYMFPGRVWQLVLGGLVALHRPSNLSPRIRQLIAAIGIALIIVGLFTIRPDFFFPAPMALLPCGGTALLLMCGEQTAAGRFLSLPAMRWIGLISYSLYLWHWPIMAFMRLEWGLTLSPGLIVIAIVASFAAGAASYYLVERPFRVRRNWPAARTVAVGIAILGTTAGISLAAPLVQRQILPLDPQIARIAAYSKYYETDAYVRQERPHACFAMFADQRYDPELCLRVVPGKHNILLVGDSHAAQYWLALTRRFPQANVLQATSSGCLPQFDPVGARWCVPVISRALALAETDRRIEGVVFAARWRPEQVASLAASVRRLVAEGVPVTVVGPIDEYDGDYAELLARALLKGDAGRVRSFRIAGPRNIERQMRPAIIAAGGTYYSVIQQECPNNRCRLFASDGSPFHTDYGHVAEGGAENLLANLPPPWQDAHGKGRGGSARN